MVVDLNDASRQPGGQRVDFPRRVVRTLEIRVDDTSAGVLDSYTGLSAVGLAEVGIGNVQADEVVRLPTDLLSALGTRSRDHRLTILLARARSSQLPPRSDEELALARVFSLPTPRRFTLTGTARVSANANDTVVDAAFGATGVRASSSGRLPGSLRARSSLAIDGDPDTFWSSGMNETDGAWLAYDLAAPVTVDHLDLSVVVDGRHSVPTRLRIEAGGVAREVDVPHLAAGPTENAVANATVRFPALTGDRLRITVVSAEKLMTLDWYSESPVALPVAVAELGIDGVRATRSSAQLPAGCRTDLVTVDGRPFGVEVTGSSDAAEDRKGLAMKACGPDADGVTLAAGSHELRTRPGRDTGIDIDRLVLESPAPATRATAESTAPAPRVEVLNEGRTSYRLRVHGARAPFWLVLGQSHNQGWAASAAGRSLGPPQLVNGYANGWYVDARGGKAIDIHLDWTPQRRVWWALALSAAGVMLCLVLAVAEPRGGLRQMRSVPNDGPELVSPLTASGHQLVSMRARIGATVAAGLGAGLVAGVPTGVIVAAAVLMALTRPSARVLLGIAGAVALALAGLYTAVQQFRYDYLAQFEWPTRFHRAHVIAWLAVCLLAADALVDVVRRRREDQTASLSERSTAGRRR